MINPLIDSFLIFVCLIVFSVIWWYARAVYHTSGKKRYAYLVVWANIAVIIGILHYGLLTTIILKALSWIFALSIMHLFYWSVIFISDFVDWLIDNDIGDWAERLAEKRHGKKDK